MQTKSLWTEADLRKQWAIAQAWLPYFEAAAAKYGFPVELLLAIASRESNMENKLGDFYNGVPHGYGVMQIDIGSDLTFCRNWTPEKVQPTIERGAKMLAEKRNALLNLGIAASLHAIAAAYNTGQTNVYHSVKDGFDPDRTTKYGTYGKDVMTRMAVFQKFRKPATLSA